MKACVLDIETSDLAAVGAGFMLLACVKPVGKPVKTFRYDTFKSKPAHEDKLLWELLKELSNYDMVIGHNVDRFDLPYIKSRSIVLGVPYALSPLTYDTLKAFRRCGFLTRPNAFGKPSASLFMVADAFDLLTDENWKTGIPPRQHWKAVWQEGGERKEAISRIAEHCERDVKLNERVFEALWRIDLTATLRRLR